MLELEAAATLSCSSLTLFTAGMLSRKAASSARFLCGGAWRRQKVQGIINPKREEAQTYTLGQVIQAVKEAALDQIPRLLIVVQHRQGEIVPVHAYADTGAPRGERVQKSFQGVRAFAPRKTRVDDQAHVQRGCTMTVTRELLKDKNGEPTQIGSTRKTQDTRITRTC